MLKLGYLYIQYMGTIFPTIDRANFIGESENKGVHLISACAFTRNSLIRRL